MKLQELFESAAYYLDVNISGLKNQYDIDDFKYMADDVGGRIKTISTKNGLELSFKFNDSLEDSEAKSIQASLEKAIQQMEPSSKLSFKWSK